MLEQVEEKKHKYISKNTIKRSKLQKVKLDVSVILQF